MKTQTLILSLILLPTLLLSQNIFDKYEGFIEPSALIIQKKGVLTELIPSIKAEPYPLFF